jgi:hypothetical protein
VYIDTWDGYEFYSARVAWLAWPDEFDGKTIRSNSEAWMKDHGAREAPWYVEASGMSRRSFVRFITLISRGLQMFSYGCLPDMSGATKEAGTWELGALGLLLSSFVLLLPDLGDLVIVRRNIMLSFNIFH